MKSHPEGVTLKKMTTPPSMHMVRASYAVFLNGERVGRVHKFVQPTKLRGVPHRGYGPIPTSTCWGWDRPGVPEDPCGYDTRREAIDWLLKSLDVPRETSDTGDE